VTAFKKGEDIKQVNNGELMVVKILFDNKRIDPIYHAGWGVSFLIGNNILFDTGENAAHLFSNMYQAGVNIQDISTVVISHEHFDHMGGLWDLLRQKQKIDIYICPSFSKSFKNKAKTYNCNIIEVSHFTEITKNIYTTGEIGGFYGFDGFAEQSLVINTKKDLTIITGCAHPGIVRIVEHVKDHIKGNIHLVIGGFHLLNESPYRIMQIIEELIQLGVTNIGPCHCTGKLAERYFRDFYRDHYVDVFAGQTIEI